MTYWDSSALLKLYVTEPDSAYFVDLAGKNNVNIHCSAILTVEALCVLSRKEQVGEIQRGAAVFDDLQRDISEGWIALVPYGNALVVQAQKVLRIIQEARSPRVLRSLDVIHLASALECGAISLIATDQRLREIATLAGLRVLP